MQKELKIIAIFIFSLLLRWCVTYHSHSGQGKPSMFGDYEAQRHWQEITFNLPLEKWYINSTSNDLLYWGLDYPPLTAYHSLLLGYIANYINASYITLEESRGLSSVDHKYFMRLSVLIADAMTFIPAIIYFVVNLQLLKTDSKRKWNILGESNNILLTALIYPGLILIDHGHFQYNCISLGLFVAAVTAISKNSIVVGSFFYVLALNYKQMELYHSLPFFFYILGYCKIHRDIYLLLQVSVTVVLTFFVIWIPFLTNWDLFVHVAMRLFPFSRGIFEDKVANVWCALNIFIKLHNLGTIQVFLCLITTLAAVFLSCADIFMRPYKNIFVICLINCALAFFLFSFQVHEKSILLAVVPVLLHFHNDPFTCFWFLLISHFSMLPLFIKDELYLAYLATMLFYVVIVLWIWPDIFSSQFTFYPLSYPIYILQLFYVMEKYRIILFSCSLLGITILSFVSAFVKPPERYPDLFPLLISIYSCIHFCAFLLYFNYAQLTTFELGSETKQKKH